MFFKCSRTWTNIFQGKRSLDSMPWYRGCLSQHAFKRSPASLEEEDKTQRPCGSCCVDGAPWDTPFPGQYPSWALHPHCPVPGPGPSTGCLLDERTNETRSKTRHYKSESDLWRKKKYTMSGEGDPARRGHRSEGICSWSWLSTSHQSMESSWQLQKTHFRKQGIHSWSKNAIAEQEGVALSLKDDMPDEHHASWSSVRSTSKKVGNKKKHSSIPGRSEEKCPRQWKK